MKEVESFKLQPDTELVSPVQQKKKFQHLGNTPIHKGHKIWEINVETLEVKLAEIKDHQVLTPQKTFINRKALITKPGCIYAPAINKYVALEKAKKQIAKNNQNIEADA